MQDHTSVDPDLAHRVAKRLWDKTEAEYWDHETDCRTFDPAPPGHVPSDYSDDPRLQSADWLEMVSEILDAAEAEKVGA